MIANPRIGRPARIHYRKDTAGFMPHHGRIGVVVARSKGPGPRNHGLLLDDGAFVVVPCGNLIPIGYMEVR